MAEVKCGRCGGKVLVRGFASLRCPICGEYIYLREANEKALWAEHRLGLLFRRDGWGFMNIIDPPPWFLENVM